MENVANSGSNSDLVTADLAVSGSATSDSAVKDLAALVLAAGEGTRMLPFTAKVPKPLLTINNEPLLQRALDLAFTHSNHVAVNANYLAPQIAAYVAELPVYVSVEDELLGTAGAVAKVREDGWLGDRPVLIINADSWLGDLPDEFVTTWDGERPRLLVKETGKESDFGTKRFIGASLLPADLAAGVPNIPCGLYEVVWRDHLADLDLWEFAGDAFDCGTPEEFLEANLAANDGQAVIHPTAQPGAEVKESVLLAGSSSPAGEPIIGQIRDGFGNVYQSRSKLARSHLS